MQQLTFDLAGPPEQTFATFRGARNGEALAAVRRLACGSERAQVCYLWGADAAGKSHLLKAAAASARLAGLPVLHLDLRAPDAGSRVGDAMLGGRYGLLLIDHVDEAAAAGQGEAFTAFNRVRDAGGNVLAAGRLPALRLTVRDDLRTRLGWGLSFEIIALDDVEKHTALDAAAAGRGLTLSQEVVNYLLRHGPRDLSSLLQALEGLDRLSLVNRRPITVHLVKDWLRAAASEHTDGGPNPPPSADSRP